MTSVFRALVRKDLRLFFANRRSVIMAFAAPIAIASFFGYMFGGNGGQTEASRISVLAVDQDASAISREIVANMTADKALAVQPAALEQARSAVRKGKATVAFVIPPAFGADAGRAFFNSVSKPVIGLLYDPSHSAEMGMVQGMLSGHVMEAVSKEMFNGQSGRQAVKDSLAQIEQSALPPEDKKSLEAILRAVDGWNAQRDSSVSSGSRTAPQGLTIPFQVHTEAITSAIGVQYNGYAHAFGGMGIQFILFVGIDVGLGLLVQRQSGVWQRLRAAPLSRATLLGSRAVSAAMTSMLVLMVLFAFARVVFGSRIEGSMAGFLCICAAFSLMTASFGLLIAALGKTPEATRGLSILATLLLVMLGGAWVPTFIFPQWLQNLTVAIPTRWAMDGLDAMTWRGLPFSSAIAPIAVLIGFTAVFGALAVMRFRWEADS
jgi:ABC-2 type transport system permease protein